VSLPDSGRVGLLMCVGGDGGRKVAYGGHQHCHHAVVECVEVSF